MQHSYNKTVVLHYRWPTAVSTLPFQARQKCDKSAPHKVVYSIAFFKILQIISTIAYLCTTASCGTCGLADGLLNLSVQKESGM